MAEIQFNGSEWEVSEALQAFYTPYASYVIQTRALPDARDGLKTGARFVLYAQYKDKLTIKEKRRKAVATVNATMRFSPHGDSSILGTAVRLSQNFSTRYPIIEVQGNNGSIMHGDDYSQSRYLEMRGGKIAWEMTELLNKETIDTWKLNYTEEEEYPTVLPTKFPFSLVNGSFGIGVACASSIPPHNLKDVCVALIKLLYNPDISFEEIYCPIDFPTGGTIINENDVKESLKNGTGKAALVRASIEYDEKNNTLVAVEPPYMAYTASIVKSISKALEAGLLDGVENVSDGTDYEGCKIYIQLTKNANVNKITKLLYKHTLLQNSFSINMNALENGKVPKLFTWKELMQAYLDHLRNIIIKSYEFDLKKIKKRIHILEGLIIAFHNIEEVVKIIRSSSNTIIAKTNLINSYKLSDEQADAILKMRLSSLTHLEIEKLEKEKEEKEIEAKRIEEILSSEELIRNEIKKEIIRINNEYGDERRTKQLSLDFTSEKEDAEPIEKKELLIYFTNLGNIYTVESSTLLKTHRAGKGSSKVKLASNEVITKIINDDNYSSLLIFSNKGKMYNLSIDELPVNGKVNLAQLFNFSAGEVSTTITSIKKQKSKYFMFITKKGLVKKTSSDEYTIRRGKSLVAIKLKDDDEVVNVLFIDNENIGLLANNGNYITISSEDITAIGRNTSGVKGIKLDDGNYIIDAQPIASTDKFMVTITENGLIKKTNLKEFPLCNRATKGKKISEVKPTDKVIKFLTLEKDNDIIIIVQKRTLKISTSEIKELSRSSIGVKAIQLDENDKVVDLVRQINE